MSKPINCPLDEGTTIKAELSIVGDVSVTETRLLIKGEGFDISIPGTASKKVVTFKVPKFAGILSVGSRDFTVEILAEAKHFKAVTGTIDFTSPASVTATVIESAKSKDADKPQIVEAELIDSFDEIDYDSMITESFDLDGIQIDRFDTLAFLVNVNGKRYTVDLADPNS